MTIRTKLLRKEKGCTYNYEEMREKKELKTEEHWEGYQISAGKSWMLENPVFVEGIA